MRLRIFLMFAMWLLVLWFLAGCASVSLETPDGLKMTSSTLWKDIESVEVQSPDFVGTLGTSTSNQDAKALLLACVLYPDLPGCKQ